MRTLCWFRGDLPQHISVSKPLGQAFLVIEEALAGNEDFNKKKKVENLPMCLSLWQAVTDFEASGTARVPLY